jgi:hypothetical protein
MKIFWAWQSDLPGRISRHFVRDALKDAIEELKQPQEIEEPSEEARRSSLHLDSDRQGVPGSPDLAREILKKIDASSVFVGDITPVGTVTLIVDEESESVAAKKLMNPNVAIELGYSIARHTDNRLIMILNTAFGGRADVPFDLRHKAGPITYELRANATGAQIKSERARLVPVLVHALRDMLPNVSTPVADVKGELPKVGKALFFARGEVLATSDSAHTKNSTHVFDSDTVLYLRVFPAIELEAPLALDVLRINARKSEAFDPDEEYHIYEQGYGWNRENQYGIIQFNKPRQAGSVESLVQYFRLGEIWGIRSASEKYGSDQLVNSERVEKTLIMSLHNFLHFQTEINKLKPPFIVEAGIEGIKGHILTIPGGVFNRDAKFATDSIVLQRKFNEIDRATQEKFLLEFFEKLHAQTGKKRPSKLFGFPPDK